MAHDKTVHRSLHLASPRQKGADVSAFQSNVNKQFDRLKIDRQVEVDGVLGRDTYEAGKDVAYALGVCGEAWSKLRHHAISEGTQALIRGGRDRTDGESEAAHRRDEFRKALRARFAKSAGEKAIERSN